MASVKANWKCLQPDGSAAPESRSSHSLIVIGRKAYVFGGEHKPRVPIGSTIHIYDLDTSTWSDCKGNGTMPSERNAQTAAAIGRKIYIFGGRQGITMGEGSLNDLHEFDTDTNNWREIQSNDVVPEARSYHAMVAHGDKLYVFGGCGAKGRMNDLHSFDVITNTWTALPTCDAITGRGGAGLVTVQNSIYVVGGFSGKEMNDVFKFDILTNSWSELSLKSPIPARSVFGICSLDSQIFVVGGEVDPVDTHAEAGQFSNNCFVMDVNSNEGWKQIFPSGSVPEPRGWFSVASVRDKKCKGVLIFGGNSSKNERLNDLYLMEIDN